MTDNLVTLTIAKERSATTGSFVFNFDDSHIYQELVSDTDGSIDVTKPLPPAVAWTLATLRHGCGTFEHDSYQQHKPFIEHQGTYWAYMRDKGVKFMVRTLEALDDDGKTPHPDAIIEMMDAQLQELATKSELGGKIAICRAGFAKFCINYSHETDTEMVKSNNWCEISDNKVIINCLNSELLFEPTYEICLTDESLKGKAYHDTAIFKFIAIADQMLKDCFFHLLRISQIELSQSELDTNHLPRNLLDTHTVCDFEEAKMYVDMHIVKLKNYLNANTGLTGAWISVKYHELANRTSQVKSLRLFAVKPKHLADEDIEPTLYVDFHPNIVGDAPEFAKEVKSLLDGSITEVSTPNSFAEMLVRAVAGNAIFRDFQNISQANPILCVPKYWQSNIKPT